MHTQQDSILIANWCCFIVHKKRLHFSYVLYFLLLHLKMHKHSTTSSVSSVVDVDFVLMLCLIMELTVLTTITMIDWINLFAMKQK